MNTYGYIKITYEYIIYKYIHMYFYGCVELRFFIFFLIVTFVRTHGSPNGQRYSMIFALKAYIGERSLRDQFQARHAINDCKARPRAVLK